MSELQRGGIYSPGILSYFSIQAEDLSRKSFLDFVHHHAACRWVRHIRSHDELKNFKEKVERSGSLAEQRA